MKSRIQSSLSSSSSSSFARLVPCYAVVLVITTWSSSVVQGFSATGGGLWTLTTTRHSQCCRLSQQDHRHLSSFSGMTPSLLSPSPFSPCVSSHRIHIQGQSSSFASRRRILPVFVSQSRSLPGDDDSTRTTKANIPKMETSLHRMRRRKSAILNRRKNLATAYLLAAWYVLSIGFNIYSKRALTLAPDLAWTTAWLQMILGLLYLLPLWQFKLRDKPELSFKDMKQMLPVAFLHALVHVGGVVSVGAGAVSFTYIVKASEPAVSAALSAMTGKFLPLPVYLTLIPTMGGVALASVSELSFTWKSFNYAMMSNVASAARGIVAKRTIDRRLGKHLSAVNLYGVMTILCTLLILPMALVMEGKTMIPSFRMLYNNGTLLPYLAQTILSAIFYYTYNEVSFMVLKNVTPVSHAIGNTLKRVFIILSSLIVFGNPMTLRGVVGSTMAVGGVFWYSLLKTKLAAAKGGGASKTK